MDIIWCGAESLNTSGEKFIGTEEQSYTGVMTADQLVR
jgi:hypothetical protein